MKALAPPCLRGHSPPWQDLPPELLGLVLQRVQSHACRVRLLAVCRSWRHAARMHPPLPRLLPWILQCDGSFLSLADGEVHRCELIPDGVTHGVSTGSMLFIVHTDLGCSLMNPLSRDRETTGARHIGVKGMVHGIRKVVVVSNHVTVNMYNCLNFWIHRPDSPPWVLGWKPPSDAAGYYYILDIALFQDKVYVLAGTRDGAHPPRLYAMDFASGDMLVDIRCIIGMPEDGLSSTDQCAHGLPHYLVASDDRLLMVQQKRELPAIQPLFEVFEAVDMSCSGQGRWRKINTLMGRALFLSEGCSDSLPAGQCVGAQDDCIYFLNERMMGPVYSGIYNIRERTMSPLLPLEKLVAPHGPWTATWFFPDVA